MTRRLLVAPSPVCWRSTSLVSTISPVPNVKGSAATMEGLLLPAERNKALTALAYSEPLK